MSALTCRRCHRLTHQDVQEFDRHQQMHRVCFHYEFEHTPQDLDLPCSPGCPSHALTRGSDDAISIAYHPDTGGPPSVVENVVAATGQSRISDLVISNNGSITASQLRFRIIPTTSGSNAPVIFLDAPTEPHDWTPRADIPPRSAHGWTCVPLSGPCDVTIELEWLEALTPRAMKRALHLS